MQNCVHEVNMKISKIEYKKLDEVNKMHRFKLEVTPKRQKTILKPLTWMISFSETRKRHLKINRVQMEGLKKPYLLLCTHHAFVDFKVTTMAIFPHRASYVVAIDGFINRELILRNAGGICKRKFTNDLVLVKHLKKVVNEYKDILCIYPEARYSIVGTNAILPESLGKLCKYLDVPVVVLNMHGNHLSSPVWNLQKRNNDITADMTQIINQKEIRELDIDAINKRINDAFIYDEYKWQKDNNIIIDNPNRAKNLHKPLYKCCECGNEEEMSSDGIYLKCNHCNSSWELTTLGELKRTDGKTTRFSHIPDWFEWERSEVKKEIESGKYKFEEDVYIDSLPNSKGFYRLGIGHVTHNELGFNVIADLEGGNFQLLKDPLSTYSIHIEYDYFGKGDCFSLSTLNDTYYLFPINKKNIVTKLHFAAEEMYKYVKNKEKA